MIAVKRLAVALFALTISASPPIAQEIVNIDGFRFPDRIGELTRTTITEFEKRAPGYGQGIRFTAPGVRADIFVYDKRISSIPDDTLSPIQKNEFTEAVAEIRRAKERGIYSDVVEGKTFEVPDVKSPFFVCQAFKVSRKNSEDEDSVLCLGARNNKFFKIRLSFFPSAAASLDAARGIVREIGAAVRF